MTFKRITNRAISGDRGIALVHRVVAAMGFAWHPTNQSVEAGIDGTIEIREPETQRATGCILQVQSKVVSGKFTAENEHSFEYLCEARDIDYWLGGNTPIILVVSRPETDEAYWTHVQGYFKDIQTRASRRVNFNKDTQRFTPQTRALLTAIAVPRKAGLYIPPVPQQEVLFTNLLAVKKYASILFIATTEHRKPGEVWAKAKEGGWNIGSEWSLAPEHLISFHDLREEPWCQFCDRGSVETFDTDEWALGDDPQKRREFTRLLNHCLRAKVRLLDIRFNSTEEMYYFQPGPGLALRRVSYQSIARESSRVVFKGYKNRVGAVGYYRHNAFKGAFKFYDGQWFLEITPSYFYSTDGYTPYHYADDLRKGIKRLERHAAVFGQVIMWGAILTSGASLFIQGYPFLDFDPLQLVDINCGVTDTDWLATEDDATKRDAAASLLEEGMFG